MNRPVVQVSLDLTSIGEALPFAAMALRAGVDWLEAGTPLLLAEGLSAVVELRTAFPDVPIVADLKTMDGGDLETAMMAQAGATHVVVMARAHEATINKVVEAAHGCGLRVMGDNMACEDKPAAARMLEDLGCDYVIHHVGYDERRWLREKGMRPPSPLDELAAVVESVQIPVQAVGGLSIEEAVRAPTMGAPLVVIGAPLAVDAESFMPAHGDVEGALRAICEQVRRISLAGQGAAGAEDGGVSAGNSDVATAYRA